MEKGLRLFMCSAGAHQITNEGVIVSNWLPTMANLGMEHSHVAAWFWAKDASDARLMMLTMARDLWPVGEGYLGHSTDVVEIESATIERMWRDYQKTK